MDSIRDEVTYYATGARRRLAEAAHRYRFRFGRNPAPLDGNRALRSLPRNPTILFLCLGNICRSPMAERYLRQRAADSGLAEVTVESAGFISREDRPSPGNAVDVAREYGVDLSTHRSATVTDEQLRRSDAVFLMDIKNWRLFSERFDGHENVYFLKSLGTGDRNAFEIADPDGEDTAAFRRAYGDIVESIDRLVASYHNTDGGSDDDR
ncbi:low molecular weight phosphatase family protein [Haloferacaceae archaeon DSL9]